MMLRGTPMYSTCLGGSYMYAFERLLWKSLLNFLLVAGVCTSIAANSEMEISFQEGDGQVEILIGRKPFTKYVYVDSRIPRPYFCDVYSPAGIQVTRNHPPIEGVDRTDHPTYHPGIWLAFGDISGEDFWRLKARIRHERFVQEAQGENGGGSFSVENVYEAEDGSEICREIAVYEIHAIPAEDDVALGFLLTQDSIFSSDIGSFVFGDQEEMGFGFRVATPISVDGGGTMTNSEGLKNEDEIWGKTAEWCDYSGAIDGRSVGMTLIPHPGNFRDSWFHARDYGFLLANPFGRKAFTGGEPSAVKIEKGEEFRYRNAVFIHSSKEWDASIPKRGYRTYLEVAK